MDLSIIIVNWNTKEFLLRCLESVCHFVKGVEMEVFVVDNGSIDESMVAVREIFPEAKFIENQINLGFAKANNQALHQSKGKYILLLNPDTQVKNEAIEELLSFMETHPEVGGAGAQLLNPDGSKQNSIAKFPSLTTELLNKSLLRLIFPRTYPGKEKNYPEPIAVDSVIGACMIVRREVIDQVGLLDEDYFLFLEETDWCYRMKRGGWEIYHVPQAEVYHFQGKGAEKEKGKARIEYYRSRYHFFKKHRRFLSWLILLTGSFIKLIIETVFWGTVSLFTLFVIRKWRQRFSQSVCLLVWHLRFCPEGVGLRPF